MVAAARARGAEGLRSSEESPEASNSRPSVPQLLSTRPESQMLSTLTISSLALAVFVLMAAAAIAQRGAPGLPDVMVEVQLGGHMKINTANGPMLLDVGKHMQCKQCHSTGFTQKGFSQLATCPCQVPVGGMKDGVYYSGVITVTKTKNDPWDVNAGGADVEPTRQSAPKNKWGDGCNTKPMHLRVTAKGSFLDGLPVFAGDARTEAMLRQLVEFFGPEADKGLVLDGTLTCKQQWDLKHPDYLIPKPGYPSDVAVKIPYGSTLKPLKNKLSPFTTEIPEALRQKYGDGEGSTRLRHGLLGAMQSSLFKRDAAQFRSRSSRGRSGSDSGAETTTLRSRRESMREALQKLANKVGDIADKTSRMDSTLSKVRRIIHYKQGQE